MGEPFLAANLVAAFITVSVPGVSLVIAAVGGGIGARRLDRQLFQAEMEAAAGKMAHEAVATQEYVAVRTDGARVKLRADGTLVKLASPQAHVGPIKSESWPEYQARRQKINDQAASRVITTVEYPVALRLIGENIKTGAPWALTRPITVYPGANYKQEHAFNFRTHEIPVGTRVTMFQLLGANKKILSEEPLYHVVTTTDKNDWFNVVVTWPSR